MGYETKIEWVDHTFNPWIGCTRVSDACDNCYAAAMAHRRGWARFEPGAARKRTSETYWKQLRRWNSKAKDAGRREKVFGPSLADPFDAEVSVAWRDDYVAEIEAADQLDFILLTKRPQVARKYFASRPCPPNLWPGVTAENQKMLVLRAAALLAIDAKVRVISAEPLLGPLDIGPYKTGIGWVIAGGESGAKARPSNPAWFRELLEQCRAAGIPFFFKQWGEWHPCTAEDAAKRIAAFPHSEGDVQMARVGRKKAGTEIDGRSWREAP